MNFGSLPLADGLLYGVKPVVIAVVLQALIRLARTAIKTKFLAAVGLVAVILSFLGINELVVLFGVGVLVGIRQWLMLQHRSGTPPSALLAVTPIVIAQAATTTVATPVNFSLCSLFYIFPQGGCGTFQSSATSSLDL